jgi:hypothetical protein
MSFEYAGHDGEILRIVCVLFKCNLFGSNRLAQTVMLLTCDWDVQQYQLS